MHLIEGCVSKSFLQIGNRQSLLTIAILIDQNRFVIQDIFVASCFLATKKSKEIP